MSWEGLMDTALQEMPLYREWWGKASLKGWFWAETSTKLRSKSCRSEEEHLRQTERPWHGDTVFQILQKKVSCEKVRIIEGENEREKFEEMEIVKGHRMWALQSTVCTWNFIHGHIKLYNFLISPLSF